VLTSRLSVEQLAHTTKTVARQGGVKSSAWVGLQLAKRVTILSVGVGKRIYAPSRHRECLLSPQVTIDIAPNTG
jgi:hypothetical protein